MGVIFADDWMEITAPIPDQAEALLQELLGHLPTLFAQTEDHISWSLPEEYIEEEGLESASFEDIAPVIQALSDYGAQHFGAPEGALTLAPSAPGLDGLGGLDQVRRRRVLATMGAALPAITLPGVVQAAGARPKGGKMLVLIELAGGNDGLNTVVPITDSV